MKNKTVDNNLQEAFDICDKILKFKNAISKELSEHPDYKAECLLRQIWNGSFDILENSNGH